MACCDISEEDDKAYKQSTMAQESGGDGLIVVPDQNAPAVAGESFATSEITENFGGH